MLLYAAIFYYAVIAIFFPMALILSPGQRIQTKDKILYAICGPVWAIALLTAIFYGILEGLKDRRIVAKANRRAIISSFVYKLHKLNIISSNTLLNIK